MRKGLWKKLIMIVFAVLCLTAPTVVHAEEKVLDGSRLTEKEEAFGGFQNVLRGSILYKGNVTITNKGNRKINCYGATFCHRICDKVEVNIYLERSKGSGGGWSSYKNWKYSVTNDSSLSKSNTIKVPGGYYYRLRGYHACEKSGYERESNSSFTNGIWIS